MGIKDLMMEAHRDFQCLCIVLLLKLSDRYMGEHFIIFTLNRTYTLCTLFECLIDLKREKAKTKKQCIWSQDAWFKILIPPLTKVIWAVYFNSFLKVYIFY